MGRPLGPAVRLGVVGPKLPFVHRAVGFSISAQREPNAVVGKLGACHTPLGGQVGNLRPIFIHGIVGKPGVEDVGPVVTKTSVDHAIEGKLIGMVPSGSREARLLAPCVGGHVVVPPIVEVHAIARAQPHVDVAFVGDECRMVAGFARAGSHLSPCPFRGVVLPEVVEGTVVVEAKPHPCVSLPNISNGVPSGFPWEIGERRPAVGGRVVGEHGRAESLRGLARHQVAGALHGESKGVVGQVAVGQRGHRFPHLGSEGRDGACKKDQGPNGGACIHGAIVKGFKTVRRDNGQARNNVAFDKYDLGFVHPRAIGGMKKASASALAFSICAERQGFEPWRQFPVDRLAICSITTLAPLLRDSACLPLETYGGQK